MLSSLELAPIDPWYVYPIWQVFLCILCYYGVTALWFLHMQCAGAILRMSMFVYCVQGTKILDESQDQDTTDLHKCVAYIRDFTPNLDESNVS